MMPHELAVVLWGRTHPSTQRTTDILQKFSWVIEDHLFKCFDWDKKMGQFLVIKQ